MNILSGISRISIQFHLLTQENHTHPNPGAYEGQDQGQLPSSNCNHNHNCNLKPWLSCYYDLNMLFFQWRDINNLLKGISTLKFFNQLT